MIDWIDPIKLVCMWGWIFIGFALCMTGLFTGIGAVFTSIETDRDCCFKILVVSVVLLIVWVIVQTFLIYNPLF